MDEGTKYFSGTCPGCGTHWNLKSAPGNPPEPPQIIMKCLAGPLCDATVTMTLVVVNG